MSESVSVERKKPGPKPKLPKVSVLERRMRDPFGSGSIPITIKTPGQWEIRIFNKTTRTGRIHDAVQKLGWVFVEPVELDGSADEYGFRELDNRLVRGEHAEEVLMKMPADTYRQIQMAKARLNLQNLGSKKTTDAVAQATAQKFGDQAGDVVSRNISVEDGRERVELDPADA